MASLSRSAACESKPTGSAMLMIKTERAGLHMGGCQKKGTLLGPLNTRGRIM